LKAQPGCAAACEAVVVRLLAATPADAQLEDLRLW